MFAYLLMVSPLRILNYFLHELFSFQK
jgi:hypothetical protein